MDKEINRLFVLNLAINKEVLYTDEINKLQGIIWQTT
jgi:hypothetical protein